MCVPHVKIFVNLEKIIGPIDFCGKLSISPNTTVFIPVKLLTSMSSYNRGHRSLSAMNIVDYRE